MLQHRIIYISSARKRKFSGIKSTLFFIYIYFLDICAWKHQSRTGSYVSADISHLSHGLPIRRKPDKNNNSIRHYSNTPQTQMIFPQTRTEQQELVSFRLKRSVMEVLDNHNASKHFGPCLIINKTDSVEFQTLSLRKRTSELRMQPHQFCH